MAWCDAAARRAAGRHFCAVQAAQSGLQRCAPRLPTQINYAYILPSKGRRRRLILPRLGPGGAMDRSRTAPPRGVPVDCSSSSNARERGATRRRESAFAVPGRKGMVMVEPERESSRAPRFRTRVDTVSDTKSNRAKRATDSHSSPGRHDPCERPSVVAWRRAGDAPITSAPRLRNEPRTRRGPRAPVIVHNIRTYDIVATRRRETASTATTTSWPRTRPRAASGRGRGHTSRARRTH